MATQYRCTNQNRLKQLLNKPTVNGIDYLEVASDQRTLNLYCANALAAFAWSPANVIITGGARVRGTTLGRASDGSEQIIDNGEIEITSITAAGKVLTILVNQSGDFSTYTLRLITSPSNLQPPSNFDRLLTEVPFSFKVDCPSDFDCAPDDCPPQQTDEPEINYLAKDYASFRRLLLDRLSVIMPGWQERNPADVQIALIELLAYVGDHLSYYQDAVATEAYLGSARRRISVRRHARMLDYAMHDGCNARTWVCFEYGNPPTLPPPPDLPDLPLPIRTPLLTKGASTATIVDPLQLDRIVQTEKPAVFETLETITLRTSRNKLLFYTWGDSNCCLPRGATQATLLRVAGLTLAVGDFLAFEEIVSPTSGLSGEADPAHRHVVRLTRVDATVEDTLFASAVPLVEPVPLVEIEWDLSDALPFPLCLSATIGGNVLVDPVSVARGNVVLADHGLRIMAPATPTLLPPDHPSFLPPVPPRGRYQPKLARGPLTQQGQIRHSVTRKLVPFDPHQPASTAMRYTLRDVRPVITLDSAGVPWKPQRELLNSSRFALEFVAEVENDDATYLRFGDQVLGQAPTPGADFTATYRIGNGVAGNVGAEAIARVVTDLSGILRVWNPLPATGGTDPESMEQVRQFAPQAFRTQERAVTEADYAEVSQRHPDIQKVVATLRWTGSWYTAFVTVDRKGGRPVDAAFELELREHLNRYRLAGYDLEINGPIFVMLDIVMTICVKPGYFRANVKEALVEIFSNGEDEDGTLGFFHPDNFTFGQTLYLSTLYEAALTVDGVDSVVVTRFQRWGKVAQGEIGAGQLRVGPFEIIRLDNDRNFPENGKLEFVMKGGL